MIQDPFIITLGKRNSSGKTIGMIHHIDLSLKKKSLKWKLYFDRFEKNVTKLDLVVTVSNFWKKYLESIGCSAVKIIYNSFNVDAFSFTTKEINNFSSKYRILQNKPLVYIGNSDIRKGVVEVYHALKDEGYTLVMTGPQNKNLQIPVIWLNLKYRDYLRLLYLCDVVITMSTVLEGWNRTAHEAMLCQTPVIGSGSGGMEELLRGGKQIISKEPTQLPELVQNAIQNVHTLSENGYKFAKKFNLHYFDNEWLSLAQNILD